MEKPQQIKNLNNRVGNTRQKGRRSAPKAEDRVTGKTDPYAYTFKDPQVGELQVLNSANAWWVKEDGKIKLQKLVDAYKIDATDDDAIFYAGITEGNLAYFQKLHPNFYRIKALCKQNLGLIAKKNFAKDIERNVNGASLAYLRTKRKDEGYTERVEQTGANGRDLFDGMTEEYKKLTEEIENDYDEEYPAGASTGDADAEQGGHEHEASPATSTETEAENIT